jgi:hypothetical protein
MCLEYEHHLGFNNEHNRESLCGYSKEMFKMTFQVFCISTPRFVCLGYSLFWGVLWFHLCTLESSLTFCFGSMRVYVYVTPSTSHLKNGYFKVIDKSIDKHGAAIAIIRIWV